MITFLTSCFEGDYLHVLTGDRLDRMIANCAYPFEKRVVIINNVKDREAVGKLAEEKKQAGIIDAYYFVSDHEDEALKFFELTKESFRGGYYFSSSEFVGLYLCDTKYALYFTCDAMVENPDTTGWIEQAVEAMEENPQYACANPFWAKRPPQLEDGFEDEVGEWFVDHGFTDQCHLVPTSVFRAPIYNEHNRKANRYPSYTGESIERRVFSYFNNHDLLRLTHKTARFHHENFPKPGVRAFLNRAKSSLVGWAASLSPRPHLHQAPGKIYDIFTFFNELELLEIRLNVLDKHVDYFVIIESTQTFSGKPKELYYEKNKERFAKWHSKIIHYIIDDVPANPEELKRRLTNPDINELDKEIIANTLTSDNVPEGQIHWFKEFYQKESIKKALVGLADNDLCFVSDLDEIWNPDVLFDYNSDNVFRLRQKMYAYYLNNRSSERWAGTLVTKYAIVKKSCLNHLRTPRKTPYTYVKNGGWHFTNVGGPDRIRQKLESYGHQEFNNDTVKADLENKIASNKDFIGRGFRFWKDETNLPEYIINNRTTYKDLFK